VALNNSQSSKAVLSYLTRLPVLPGEVHITLLHIFREPSTVQDLMGEKFKEELPRKLTQVLEGARERLLKMGCLPDQVTVNFVTEPYPTVTEGIIDQFNKGEYNMVVIGRKRMSKAEEFVMGDISVKLIRTLDEAAVLVIKSS